MASPLLRLDADVTSQGGRNRLTIYFSHIAAAQDYERYLQALGASWKIVLKEEAKEEKGGEDVDLKASRKGKVLSMNLPSSVSVLEEENGKVIALSFEDDIGAKAWDQKMLLWTGYPGTKQTLSRSLTLEALNQSLMSSSQHSRLYSGQVIERPMTNVGGVYGVFGPPVTQSVGGALRFGRKS